MTKHTMKWAIAKIREYADDDEIDREKLTPLLKAYDSGDMPEFFKQCTTSLYDYAAGEHFCGRTVLVRDGYYQNTSRYA